jgi:hypothetical protein
VFLNTNFSQPCTISLETSGGRESKGNLEASSGSSPLTDTYCGRRYLASLNLESGLPAHHLRSSTVWLPFNLLVVLALSQGTDEGRPLGVVR